MTIPYKENIINYLDDVDDLAHEIGAVNTICFENQKRIGYNTDIIGFKKTLEINSLDNFYLIKFKYYDSNCFLLDY